MPKLRLALRCMCVCACPCRDTDLVQDPAVVQSFRMHRLCLLHLRVEMHTHMYLLNLFAALILHAALDCAMSSVICTAGCTVHTWIFHLLLCFFS